MISVPVNPCKMMNPSLKVSCCGQGGIETLRGDREYGDFGGTGDIETSGRQGALRLWWDREVLGLLGVNGY